MKSITRDLSSDCARMFANTRFASDEIKIKHADVDLDAVHRKATQRPYLVTGYGDHEGLLLMSWNIRYRTKESREEDNWEERLPHLFAILSVVEPHILCLQEVLPSQRAHLDKLLGDKYFSYGSMRTSPWLLGDEMNPVYFRKTLEPLEKKTVRIGHGRIFTHVRFPHAINVVCTHWDAFSPANRRKNQETLQAYLKSFQLDKQFLFVLGDFNCSPIGSPLAVLCDELSLRATCYQGTFTGFDRSGNRFGVLDNICVPKNQAGSASIVEVFLEGQKKYPSDHEPLVLGVQ